MHQLSGNNLWPLTAGTRTEYLTHIEEFLGEDPESKQSTNEPRKLRRSQ